MGVDLTIIPNRYPGSIDYLGNDRLMLHRDYRLWDQINALPKHPFPKPVLIYEGDSETDGELTEDRYGDPLKFVYAREFRKVGVPDVSSWNRAILSMLCALPDQTEMILFWH